MNSKDAILGRIREALGDPAPPTNIPRDYRLRTNTENLLGLLEERLLDYRANVQRCTPNAINATIRATLERLQIQTVIAPTGLPSNWVQGINTIPDHQLEVAALDAAPAVLTACALAIAETGTIVLDHSPDQGRRVITLLPDVHICVVMAAQTVDNLPSAMQHLAPSVNAHNPITFISGPSATSDIELNRVEGVHGPRTLEVILVEASV